MKWAWPICCQHRRGRKSPKHLSLGKFFSILGEPGPYWTGIVDIVKCFVARVNNCGWSLGRRESSFFTSPLSVGLCLKCHEMVANAPFLHGWLLVLSQPRQNWQPVTDLHQNFAFLKVVWLSPNLLRKAGLLSQGPNEGSFLIAMNNSALKLSRSIPRHTWALVMLLKMRKLSLAWKLREKGLNIREGNFRRHLCHGWKQQKLL